MGSGRGSGTRKPRRPSGFSRRELQEELDARQRHLGVDPDLELTNERVLRAHGMQIDKARGPVEPLDALLGKFAHDYFGDFFGREAGDWQREVKVYTSGPGELQSRPLRIDRVRKRPNGDVIVEIKPDTPKQVSTGRRRVKKVYKPLREKGTGRPVTRALVKTYSKKQVFLFALKTGYIDLSSEHTLDRLPERWRRELRRIVASRPKAAGTPATPLGTRTVRAGGRKTGRPERPPPRRGTGRPPPNRGTPDLLPDAVRRRGGTGASAVGEVVGQVLGKGHQLLNDEIIARHRRPLEPSIRDYTLRGKFVAVWADYEQVDSKDVLRGIDPKLDEIAIGVHLTVGNTEAEALGEQETKVGPAPRGRRLERRVRKPGETRSYLLHVVPPVDDSPQSDPSILGPYRIVRADAGARRADPLALARTLRVTDGSMERFAVKFQSTDALYRGIVTRPGYNGFVAVFVRFLPKSTNTPSYALPKNWHYAITSDLSAHKVESGHVFLLERFEGIPRGGRLHDRGTILWQRTTGPS